MILQCKGQACLFNNSSLSYLQTSCHAYEYHYELPNDLGNFLAIFSIHIIYSVCSETDSNVTEAKNLKENVGF
jgi:hypothetical protein